MKKPIKSTKVVLDPKTIASISIMLKRKRMDYYLFFEIIYQTGAQGNVILRMTVAEMEQFCEEYLEFISESLMNSIKEHCKGKKKSDFFFSASRNPAQCLSKRTTETVLAKAGKEFGLANFSVKTLSRTFLYERLRECAYSFDDFQVFLRSRNRFFSDIDAFIDYCGLTVREYEKDVVAHTSSVSALSKDCDQIIKTFRDIKAEIASSRINGDKYRELAELIMQVAALLNLRSK